MNPKLAARDLRVLHQDADLLVVDKPSGIATTSPNGRDCLVELVRELDRGAAKHHPTSRLDAEVSGVVTFARTSRGIEHCLAMRREGRYARLYLAIVARAPSPADGVWRGAIAVDSRDRRKRVVSEDEDALESITDYATPRTLPVGALLELRPRTGRTHQLRVHAKDAGVPLVGDVHYGGERRLVLADGRIVSASRVMLHCARVSMPLPSGGVARFVSPPAADFRRTWNALGGEDGDLAGVVDAP